MTGNMVEEFKLGQMGANTQETGAKARCKARAS